MRNTLRSFLHQSTYSPVTLGTSTSTATFHDVTIKADGSTSISVNGNPSPYIHSESIQNKIYVQGKIVLDNINDDWICGQTVAFLEACILMDAPVDETLKLEAYTMEVEGDTGFKCIASNILKVLQTIKFIGFAQDWTGTIHLSESVAPNINTVILDGTHPDRMHWKFNGKLKKFMCTNNPDSANTSTHFKDLTYNYGLVHVEIDNWDGTNLAALLPMMRLITMKRVILFHMDGHGFAFAHRYPLYNIGITVDRSATLVDIFASVFAGFAYAMSLRIWVLDQNDTKNDIGQLLPAIYALGGVVKRLILVQLNESFAVEKMLDNFRLNLIQNKQLPNLKMLKVSIGLDAAAKGGELGNLKQRVNQFRIENWPENVDGIGLIIHRPTDNASVTEYCHGETVEVNAILYPVYNIKFRGFMNKSRVTLAKIGKLLTTTTKSPNEESTSRAKESPEEAKNK